MTTNLIWLLVGIVIGVIWMEVSIVAGLLLGNIISLKHRDRI